MSSAPGVDGRRFAGVSNSGDGGMRSHETWAWESRPGTGASVVEEVTGRT
ncbi:hypothetical protein [Pseudonocardia sp. ICBG1034]|nr:hypothetical protein [Pseudonocardia sp. ICBG1034]